MSVHGSRQAGMCVLRTIFCLNEIYAAIARPRTGASRAQISKRFPRQEAERTHLTRHILGGTKLAQQQLEYTRVMVVCGDLGNIWL